MRRRRRPTYSAASRSLSRYAVNSSASKEELCHKETHGHHTTPKSSNTITTVYIYIYKYRVVGATVVGAVTVYTGFCLYSLVP